MWKHAILNIEVYDTVTKETLASHKTGRWNLALVIDCERGFFRRERAVHFGCKVCNPAGMLEKNRLVPFVDCIHMITMDIYLSLVCQAKSSFEKYLIHTGHLMYRGLKDSLFIEKSL